MYFVNYFFSSFIGKTAYNGEVLYFMLMLPSKVMPYLLWLAAPLMDSSIVHCTGTTVMFVLMLIWFMKTFHSVKSSFAPKHWKSKFEKAISHFIEKTLQERKIETLVILAKAFFCLCFFFYIIRICHWGKVEPINWSTKDQKAWAGICYHDDWRLTRHTKTVKTWYRAYCYEDVLRVGV